MRQKFKCFASLIFISVVLLMHIALKDMSNSVVLVVKSKVNYFPDPNETENNELKYILQWTSNTTTPFVNMGVGRNVFIEKNCKYTNCYVTSDRNFLANYTTFDAIVFAGSEIIYYWKTMMPRYRSPHQKYVYANIESAANYPVCTNQFDRYFNWTWTYKLDSDLRWGYIIVRDSKRNIVGPNKEMHWIRREDMLPVSEKLKKELHGKTRPIAWFVSNCDTLSNREYLAANLSKVLKLKYNLSIDIYGKCGTLRCSRGNETICNEIVRQNYFFYLSFENAFSEDYVTEKLLRALQNNAIPIVYGGANYSRFLPKGSYLDAREMNVENLAAKINELVHDFAQYVEYFRWTNHYSYHSKAESAGTDDYCQMCALLNNKSKVKKTSAYETFTSWWNEKEINCYDNFVNYMFYI